MYFYPRNKYLHVETEEQKAEDGSTTTTGFILPSDYKRQDSPIKVVKLLSASKDSSYVSDEGNFLLVPTHNVETVEVEGKKISVVPEHAVYGVILKV